VCPLVLISAQDRGIFEVVCLRIASLVPTGVRSISDTSKLIGLFRCWASRRESSLSSSSPNRLFFLLCTSHDRWRVGSYPPRLVWPATAVCCTLPLDTVVPYVSALEYNYGGFIPPGQNLTWRSWTYLLFSSCRGICVTFFGIEYAREEQYSVVLVRPLSPTRVGVAAILLPLFSSHGEYLVGSHLGFLCSYCSEVCCGKCACFLEYHVPFSVRGLFIDCLLWCVRDALLYSRLFYFFCVDGGGRLVIFFISSVAKCSRTVHVHCVYIVAV
jgi:hypothetical protein